MLFPNLMNLLKISQTKFLLLLIVCLAFSLRIINLTVGFPGLFVSNDEAILHMSALNMIANKTIFTLGNYGPLGSYVQLPFIALGSFVLLLSGKIHSVADLQYLLLTQEGYFIFIPRVISALFGTLIVLSTFRLSSSIFGKKQLALWSSFFAAVSFNLVHISHLARSLSPAIFFATLTVLFSVHCVKESRSDFKNTLLAFGFAAVAFGFHQVVGMIVLVPILISIRKIPSKRLAESFLFWLFLIFILNFLSLGDKFNQVFRPNNSLGLLLIRTPSFWLHQNTYEISALLFENVKLFWELILTDGLIFLLAIVGFLKVVEKRIKYAFSSYFLLGLFFSIFVFPPILRYSLQLIVFLPVFAGAGVYYLLKKSGRLTIFFIIFLASFNSIYWDAVLTRESTFTQMRRWVDNNIPVETPTAVTFYRMVGYTPSFDAAQLIRNFKPGYYQRSSNILKSGNYPYNVRNIVYLENFGRDSKRDNLTEGLRVFPAEYVIDGYYKDSDRVLSMTNNLELVAHFSPTGDAISGDRIPEMFQDAPESLPLFKLERPGIYFDVLRVK